MVRHDPETLYHSRRLPVPPMIRTLVIQAVINARAARTYLEIGVDRGANFFPLRAEHKIAVDPSFNIDLRERNRWESINPANRPARFYPVPSDDFFRSAEAPHQIDVAFIDGLHTAAQVLRDVDHCLERMDETGVILLHDCNPPHKAAAFPAESLKAARAARLPGWTGEWCGDVWKAVVHLRCGRPDLKVFVIDHDYGIGVVTRRELDSRVADAFTSRSNASAPRYHDPLTPETPLNLAPAAIDALTWSDLEHDRQRLLGLKSLGEFFAFLGSPAWPAPVPSVPSPRA